MEINLWERGRGKEIIPWEDKKQQREFQARRNPEAEDSKEYHHHDHELNYHPAPHLSWYLVQQRSHHRLTHSELLRPSWYFQWYIHQEALLPANGLRRLRRQLPHPFSPDFRRLVLSWQHHACPHIEPSPFRLHAGLNHWSSWQQLYDRL